MYVIPKLVEAETALSDVLGLWDETPENELQSAIRGALINLQQGQLELAGKVQSGELEQRKADLAPFPREPKKTLKR